MTEGQTHYEAGRERFDAARRAVEDHIGPAVVSPTSEPSGAVLDEDWLRKLGELEMELDRAIADLMLAAREVMGEQAAGQG